MRRVIFLVGLICGFFWLSTAQATVRIDIDLTTQTMRVESPSGSYTWPVSTARGGYVTPRGVFHPYALQRMHFSRKYHMSPMPYSIFFAGGYAIHGTYSVAQLGRPASHGCIRLAPANAATLYHMVQAEGAAISITGSPPGGRAFAHHARSRHAAAYRARYPLAYVPTLSTWQAQPMYWQ